MAVRATFVPPSDAPEDADDKPDYRRGSRAAPEDQPGRCPLCNGYLVAVYGKTRPVWLCDCKEAKSCE